MTPYNGQKCNIWNLQVALTLLLPYRIVLLCNSLLFGLTESGVQTNLNEIENIKLHHAYFGHYIFRKPLISKATR